MKKTVHSPHTMLPAAVIKRFGGSVLNMTITGGLQWEAGIRMAMGAHIVRGKEF